jgi:hypothetical protein
MRRTKFIVVPVLALLVFAVFASPAAAQNMYVALRYWSTQTSVSLSGAPAFRAYDNYMVNLSVRRNFGPDWALSFNLDTGAQRNWAGTWVSATAGSNTYWNVNFHRNFAAPNANFSLFLGYGSASSRSTFFGVDQTQRVAGLRAGGDLLWRRNNWSLMAWGAVGISPQGTSEWPGFATSAQGTGSFSEYGALVGYTFSSGWSVEGGWRQVKFGVPAGGSFLAADFTTNGWTIGLSRMFP